MTTDHYADGTCSWWHLSQPPPELVAAVGDGWLPGGGRVLDVGCGLGTETGYLASAGWQAVGIDLAGTALAQAAAGHQEAAFLRADVRHLPLRRTGDAFSRATRPGPGARDRSEHRVVRYCGR